MDSITVHNLMPFIIGDVHAHVDRILRDKGMMNQDIASAIMSFTRSEFLDRYVNQLKEHYRVNDIAVKISEKENGINRGIPIFNKVKPNHNDIDVFIDALNPEPFTEIRTKKYILRINRK